MPKKKVPGGLDKFRAHSWSGAADGNPTERQPHMFYRCGDVDTLIDGIVAQHTKTLQTMETRFAFERRKWQALEAFYLQELGLN
jgi:hypothetical protein